MAIQLYLSQSPFKSSELPIKGTKWTISELVQEAIENDTQEIQHMAVFAEMFGSTETDHVLTCYISKKDDQLYFTLPTVMREGADLVLEFGEVKIPIIFTDGVHTANGVPITPSPVRDDNKNVIGVNFTVTIKLELDEVEEDVDFCIPVRFVKDTQYKTALAAIKQGEVPEYVTEKQSGFSVALKTYMLPPDLYKVGKYETPEKGDFAGKIWSAWVTSLTNGSRHYVNLGTTPFSIKGVIVPKLKNTANGQVANKGLYMMVSGGYNFDGGELKMDSRISALIDVKQLTEINGVCPDETIAKFRDFAQAAIDGQRASNQGRILKQSDIDERIAKLKEDRAAKSAAKKDAAISAVPMARNPEATPADFDEIPF